jgi:hippurate hydrolase
LVSREIPTGKPAVVTIGSINGGSVPNVIPNEVTMKLTLRSYEPEVRQKLLAGITRIANGVAVGRGVPPDRMPIVTHVTSESTDSTVNDPVLADQLFGIWKRELEDVRVGEPRMGGEDFPRYSGPDRAIPSVYAHVGASDPKMLEDLARTGKPTPTTHQSTFAPLPEPTIRAGIMAMVTAATNLLKAAPST